MLTDVGVLEGSNCGNFTNLIIIILIRDKLTSQNLTLSRLLP